MCFSYFQSGQGQTFETSFENLKFVLDTLMMIVHMPSSQYVYLAICILSVTTDTFQQFILDKDRLKIGKKALKISSMCKMGLLFSISCHNMPKFSQIGSTFGSSKSSVIFG